MRKQLLIIALTVTAAFTSCSKDEEAKKEEKSSIQGEWLLKDRVLIGGSKDIHPIELDDEYVFTETNFYLSFGLNQENRFLNFDASFTDNKITLDHSYDYRDSSLDHFDIISVTDKELKIRPYYVHNPEQSNPGTISNLGVDYELLTRIER